jgi:hypothetical protein
MTLSVAKNILHSVGSNLFESSTIYIYIISRKKTLDLFMPNNVFINVLSLL